MENDPLNTSPHIPVRAKLTCPCVVIESSDQTSQRPRPQWDKADLMAYRHAIMDLLSTPNPVPQVKPALMKPPLSSSLSFWMHPTRQ